MNSRNERRERSVFTTVEMYYFEIIKRNEEILVLGVFLMSLYSRTLRVLTHIYFRPLLGKTNFH